MGFLECLELISKQDVTDSAIAKHELVVRAVFIFESGLQDLIDGSDSSAAGDVANLLSDLSRRTGFQIKATETFISDAAMGSRHPHHLIKLHLFQVLSHRTTFGEFRVCILAVDFDDEIDKSLIFDCGNGSVLSNDLFAFYIGVEHYMVTDW